MANYYFNDTDILYDKNINLRLYAYLLARTAYDRDTNQRYITYMRYKELYNGMADYFKCCTKTITRQYKRLIDSGLLEEKYNKDCYFPIGAAISVEYETLMKLVDIDNEYAVNVYLQLRQLDEDNKFSIRQLGMKMGYKDKSTRNIKSIHEAIDLLKEHGLIDYTKTRVNIAPYFVLLDIKG